MVTLSCTAELKPTMMRSKDNRHDITKNVEQSSLTIITKEEDRTLGLRIPRFTINNPDTEIRRNINHITRLVSTQIRTGIQIDSTTLIDRAALGSTDQTAANKLSKTSALSQKTATLKRPRTFLKATIYPHPTQFIFLKIRDKIQ